MGWKPRSQMNCFRDRRFNHCLLKIRRSVGRTTLGYESGPDRLASNEQAGGAGNKSSLSRLSVRASKDSKWPPRRPRAIPFGHAYYAGANIAKLICRIDLCMLELIEEIYTSYLELALENHIPCSYRFAQFKTHTHIVSRNRRGQGDSSGRRY